MQCSCGNPLHTFEHDVDNADVTFKGNGKKWKAYDPKKVVKVEPVAQERPVTTYELVDIEEKGAGLERRVGTDGAQDEVLPEDPSVEKHLSTEKPEVRVPAVTGLSAQEATQTLEDQGFRVQTNDGASGSAAPGTVLGQNPAVDEKVAPGATVTLTLAPGPNPSGTKSPLPSPPTSPPTADSGTAVVTALANAAVRKSPSPTSPKVSSVAVGGHYPAVCYRHGETTNAHGPTGDLWVQLRLRSGGLGWVAVAALQEGPAAGGLRQC
ncbi:PASTA domain-containing protein [Streptomyces sp. NPDC001549]|uniref:PASTA domain-containing protein n=1 Tax=Streptomyces sp. NPDC001549 TaxID=3364586 RepID=UPI003698F020